MALSIRLHIYGYSISYQSDIRLNLQRVPSQLEAWFLAVVNGVNCVCPLLQSINAPELKWDEWGYENGNMIRFTKNLNKTDAMASITLRMEFVMSTSMDTGQQEYWQPSKCCFCWYTFKLSCARLLRYMVILTFYVVIFMSMHVFTK